MTDDQDVRPPRPSGSHQESLCALLDYSREAMLRKLAGLSAEEVRRPMVPSGVSLLGMVKHLAYVERWWFQAVFAGEDVDFPWTDDDPDADWRVEPDESTAAIVALYEAETARSHEIVANATLEDVSRWEGTSFPVGWLLPYMIQEVSRHNGHADIQRELIDGQMGR